MRYVFGPVHSRRLGMSLGIDPVQAMTCTLDCVYCQLGKTGVQTLERRAYVPADAVIEEVQQTIDAGATMDCITFSGTGEPTLSSELGRMICAIRDLSRVPVVVITNSSLLHRTDVRNDLLQADLVIPSASAIHEQVFTRLCRPLPGFDLTQMLQGLERFSRTYTGRLWVEVMLVAGVNDSEDELQALADFLNTIRCEKIQINTVTRPPSERACIAVDTACLQRACQLFGQRAEIISPAPKVAAVRCAQDIPQRITALVRSHPCTLGQICATLGLEAAQAAAALNGLLSEGHVQKTSHKGDVFYRAFGR